MKKLNFAQNYLLTIIEGDTIEYFGSRNRRASWVLDHPVISTVAVLLFGPIVSILSIPVGIVADAINNSRNEFDEEDDCFEDEA